MKIVELIILFRIISRQADGRSILILLLYGETVRFVMTFVLSSKWFKLIKSRLLSEKDFTTSSYERRNILWDSPRVMVRNLEKISMCRIFSGAFKSRSSSCEPTQIGNFLKERQKESEWKARKPKLLPTQKRKSVIGVR